MTSTTPISVVADELITTRFFCVTFVVTASKAFAFFGEEVDEVGVGDPVDAEGEGNNGSVGSGGDAGTD